MSPGFGTLDIFPSIWGHWAGGPGDSPDDLKWLDHHLRRFFSGVVEGTDRLSEQMAQMATEDGR